MALTRAHFFVYALPLFVWSALMLAISSLPGPSIPEIPVVNWDKFAHSFEYGVLGWLFLRFLCGAVPRVKHRLLVALVGGILFGALDELHQLFIPFRSANMLDFGADALGVVAGCYAYHFFCSVRKKSP